MNTGRLRLGMLSILLSVIVICMGVLSLLSFATSMADYRLSNRYAQTIRIRYALEEEGRELLSRMGDTDIIETEIEKEGYKLIIGAEKENGKVSVTAWSILKIWEEDTSIDDLWKGD